MEHRATSGWSQDRHNAVTRRIGKSALTRSELARVKKENRYTESGTVLVGVDGRSARRWAEGGGEKGSSRRSLPKES